MVGVVVGWPAPARTCIRSWKLHGEYRDATAPSGTMEANIPGGEGQVAGGDQKGGGEMQRVEASQSVGESKLGRVLAEAPAR
jgi:hypothetical protein